jgi:hypothetical protein
LHCIDARFVIGDRPDKSQVICRTSGEVSYAG